MKKLLSVTFCAAAMFAFAGCDGYVYTDGHWNGGHVYHPHPYHPGPVYPGPHYNPNPHNGHHHPGHPGHNHGPGCGHHHPFHDVAGANEAEGPVASLSANYDIKPASAETILRIAGAKKKVRLAALSTAGVSAADMAPLFSRQMPSQATIKTMATKLGEDQAKLERLFQDFIADASAEDAAK